MRLPQRSRQLLPLSQPDQIPRSQARISKFRNQSLLQQPHIPERNRITVALKIDNALRLFGTIAASTGSLRHFDVVVDDYPVVYHRNTGIFYFFFTRKTRGRKMDVVGLPLQWWKRHRNVRHLEFVKAGAPL